jgi:uncharacterized protein (DUF1697 family)
VQTFIASGNVIFTTQARELPALERRIEAGLQAEFGHAIETFIRTDAELAAIAALEPCDATGLAAVQTDVIGFLAAPPDDAARAALAAFDNPDDRFVLHGRELYWISRNKQSASTFSNAAFERALGLRATFRGRNTLRRLTALYPPARG